jgi:hypothetical protein
VGGEGGCGDVNGSRSQRRGIVMTYDDDDFQLDI